MSYSDDVKKINLVDFLKNAFGIEPVKYLENGALYFNPFKHEENPSFTVFKNTKASNIKNENWLFKDHADNSINGVGNIIEFVMRSNSINSVSEALKFIKSHENGLSYNNKISFDYVVYEKNKNTNKKYEIVKIQNLSNRALIEYLQSRKINIEISKNYLKEIYYYNIDKEENKKHYFALCWENLENGYDLRNQHFKGNLGGKGITFVKGKSSENILIFEGMISFLSALTYYKVNIPKYDTIILNSINQVSKASEYINLNKPKKIYDFLDNDFAGQGTIIQLKKSITNYKPSIINAFTIYQKYNDFNDFLKVQ